MVHRAENPRTPRMKLEYDIEKYSLRLIPLEELAPSAVDEFAIRD
jgi:hypothetical protein